MLYLNILPDTWGIPYGNWIVGTIILFSVFLIFRKRILASFKTHKSDKTIGLNDPIVDETNRSKFENGKAIIVATADPNVRPLKKAEEEKLAIQAPDILAVEENKVNEQILGVNYVEPELAPLPFTAFLPEDSNNLDSVIAAHHNVPLMKLPPEEEKKVRGIFSKMYEALLPDFFSGLPKEGGFEMIRKTLSRFFLPSMSPGYSLKAENIENIALTFLKDALRQMHEYRNIKSMETELKETYPYNNMQNILPVFGERVEVISNKEIKEIMDSIKLAIDELDKARTERPANVEKAEESIKEIKKLVDSAVQVLDRNLLSVDDMRLLKKQFYPSLDEAIKFIKEGEELAMYDVAKSLSILRKKDFLEFIDIENSAPVIERSASESGSPKMTKPENKSVRRKVVKKNGVNGSEKSATEQTTLSVTSQEELSANTNGSEIVNEAENLTEPVVKEEAVTA